jgi:hypothetical protein
MDKAPDSYKRTDYEVMVRVKSFMPKDEGDFRQWAERMGLPERVSSYFACNWKLSLEDLATTAKILKCSSDVLLFGALHEKYGSHLGGSEEEAQPTLAPARRAYRDSEYIIVATLLGKDYYHHTETDFEFFRNVPVKIPREVALAIEDYVVSGRRAFKLEPDPHSVPEPDPDADVDAVFGVEFKAFRNTKTRTAFEEALESNKDDPER